ncbi:MAG: signal peptidase I [Halobacteriovoraceae bacterium]|nr:signal peptidase I [Halobacteriovoraceae bacterium]
MAFFKKKQKKKKTFKEEFPSLVIIIFVVLVFRSVLFEPYKIPTGSMIPTLMIGDYILVNKFAYGLKVPFSDWFGEPTYISGPSQPKKGEVIVFKYPIDPSFNYIKRVVGVPGDTIEVIDKVLYINDKPVEMDEFDGKEIMEDMDDKFKDFNFRFYHSKTGEHEHVIQLDTENYYSANFEKITIPENMFFVMGDNRDHSHDSRGWGFVPMENIKGEALFVWFSMTLPFSWPWEEDLDHPLKFRPWRIGTGIN